LRSVRNNSINAFSDASKIVCEGGNSAPWTWNPIAGGMTTHALATQCSQLRTPHSLPGMWSKPTTKSGLDSIVFPISSAWCHGRRLCRKRSNCRSDRSRKATRILTGTIAIFLRSIEGNSEVPEAGTDWSTNGVDTFSCDDPVHSPPAISTRDYLQLTRALWIHSGLMACMSLPNPRIGMFVPAASWLWARALCCINCNFRVIASHCALLYVPVSKNLRSTSGFVCLERGVDAARSRVAWNQLYASDWKRSPCAVATNESPSSSKSCRSGRCVCGEGGVLRTLQDCILWGARWEF